MFNTYTVTQILCVSFPFSLVASDCLEDNSEDNARNAQCMLLVVRSDTQMWAVL